MRHWIAERTLAKKDRKSSYNEHTVIQVNVGDDDTFWEGISIHSEVVVLRRYLNLSGSNVTNRVVSTVVPKEQLERFASKRLA